MPFRNHGLQVAEYVHDFSVDGGATATIDLSAKTNYEVLPVGVLVSHVVARVVTAYTSGGSATLSFGPGADVDGYILPVAVAALTANSAHATLGALLWDDTGDQQLWYTTTSTANTRSVVCAIGTATMTAGKSIVLVPFLYPSI